MSSHYHHHRPPHSPVPYPPPFLAPRATFTEMHGHQEEPQFPGQHDDFPPPRSSSIAWHTQASGASVHYPQENSHNQSQSHTQSPSPAPIPPHLLIHPGAPAHLFGHSQQHNSMALFKPVHAQFLVDGEHADDDHQSGDSLDVMMLNDDECSASESFNDYQQGPAAADGTSSSLADRIRAHAHLLQPPQSAPALYSPDQHQYAVMPHHQLEHSFDRNGAGNTGTSSSCISSPSVSAEYQSMLASNGAHQQYSHDQQQSFPQSDMTGSHNDLRCKSPPASYSHETQPDEVSSGLSSAPSSPTPPGTAFDDDEFDPDIASDNADDDDDEFQPPGSRQRRRQRQRQRQRRRRCQQQPSLFKRQRPTSPVSHHVTALNRSASASASSSLPHHAPSRSSGSAAYDRVYSSPPSLIHASGSETSAAMALRRLATEHRRESTSRESMQGDYHGLDLGDQQQEHGMAETIDTGHQELIDNSHNANSDDGDDGPIMMLSRSPSPATPPPATIALASSTSDALLTDPPSLTYLRALSPSDTRPVAAENTSDDQTRPLSPLLHHERTSSTHHVPPSSAPMTAPPAAATDSNRSPARPAHIAGQVEFDALDDDDLEDLDDVGEATINAHGPPSKRATVALHHPVVDGHIAMADAGTAGVAADLLSSAPQPQRRASAVVAAAAVAAAAADLGDDEDDDEDMDVDEYHHQGDGDEDEEDDDDDDDDDEYGRRRPSAASADHPARGNPSASTQPLAEPATPTVRASGRGGRRGARARINSTGGHGGNATADDWTVQFTSPLTSVTEGWSQAEFNSAKRRLVRLSTAIDWDARIISITPHVVRMAEYNPNAGTPAGHGPLVSCIWWAERNGWYMTSVDYIRMMEGMVKKRFSIDEKNRIRRNMETFRPVAVHKPRSENAQGARFFRTVMQFGDPKPRKIEKDIKVFRWNVLEDGIIKLVTKWSLRKSDLLDPNAQVEAPATAAAAAAAAGPAADHPRLTAPAAGAAARNNFDRDNSPLSSPPPSDPPAPAGTANNSPRIGDNPHTQLPPPPGSVPAAATRAQQLALQRVSTAMALESATGSRQRTETGDTSLSTVYTANLLSSPEMRVGRCRANTSGNAAAADRGTAGSRLRGVASSPLVGGGNPSGRQRTMTSYSHLSAVSELDSILGLADQFATGHHHHNPRQRVVYASYSQPMSPILSSAQPRTRASTIALPTSPSVSRDPTAVALLEDSASLAHLRTRAETGETVVLPSPTLHLPPPVRLPSREQLDVAPVFDDSVRPNQHHERMSRLRNPSLVEAAAWDPHSQDYHMPFYPAPTTYGPNGLGRDHGAAASQRDNQDLAEPMAIFPPPPILQFHEHYLRRPRSESPSDDPMDLDLPPPSILRQQQQQLPMPDPRSEHEDIFSDIYPNGGGAAAARPADLAPPAPSFAENLLASDDAALFSDDAFFAESILPTSDVGGGGGVDELPDPLAVFLSQSQSQSTAAAFGGSQLDDVTTGPTGTAYGLGISRCGSEVTTRTATAGEDPLMAYLDSQRQLHEHSRVMSAGNELSMGDDTFNNDGTIGGEQYESTNKSQFSIPPLSMTARRSAAAPPPLNLQSGTAAILPVHSTFSPHPVNRDLPLTPARTPAHPYFLAHEAQHRSATYSHTSRPTVAELDLVMDPHGNVFAIAPVNSSAVASLSVNPAGIAAATAAIVPPSGAWIPMSPPQSAMVGQSAFGERVHSWSALTRPNESPAVYRGSTSSQQPEVLTPMSPQFPTVYQQPISPLNVPYVNGLLDNGSHAVAAFTPLANGFAAPAPGSFEGSSDESLTPILMSGRSSFAAADVPNLLCLGGGDVSAAFDAVAATAAAMTHQHQGASDEVNLYGNAVGGFPDSGRGRTSDSYQDE